LYLYSMILVHRGTQGEKEGGGRGGEEETGGLRSLDPSHLGGISGGNIDSEGGRRADGGEGRAGRGGEGGGSLKVTALF
jgi:hypothetical protein